MSSRSIQRLRYKFIFSAMISMFLGMLFIGGLIYVTNVIITARNVKNIIYYIEENEGIIPYSEAENETNTNIRRYEESLADSLARLFGMSTDNAFDSTEQMYSTSYFSVIFDADDTEKVTAINNFTATLDDDTAESYSRSVRKHRAKFGSYKEYYYDVSELDSGAPIVVFLNAQTQIDTNMRLLYTVLILLSSGMIITFILVWMLSYRIIQPEIENAENQKSFITNASHELKTPLAVIRANTELEEMINGESEWSRSTMCQVDRMTALISNLVTIVRAQEKEDKTVLTDIDITKAVADTVDTFEPVAVQDGKHVEREISDNIHMVADDSKIRQLTTLLIDNAIKYCDKEGTIKVSLDKKGKYVRLIVSNSYVKGANVDYNKFFDRFYREDKSHNTSDNKSGFGIGLSIAESLVEQYSGSINASWKDGVISFTCLLL